MLTIEKFEIFYKALNSHDPALPASHPVVRLATDYFNFLNEPEIFAQEKNKTYLIAKVRNLFASGYFDDFLEEKDMEDVIEDIEADGRIFAELPVSKRGVFLHEHRVKEKRSVPAAQPKSRLVLGSEGMVFFDIVNQRIMSVQQLIKQRKLAEAITLCKVFLSEIEVTEEKSRKTNFQYELAVALDYYFYKICQTHSSNLFLIVQAKLECILAWERVKGQCIG